MRAPAVAVVAVFAGAWYTGLAMAACPLPLREDDDDTDGVPGGPEPDPAPEGEPCSAPATVSGGPLFDTPVFVVDAVVAGDRAVVTLQDRVDEIAVEFTVDEAAPPLLPAPASEVSFDVELAVCYGEGCDFAFWALSDVDGAPYFEVGSASFLGDDDTVLGGPQAQHHLGVVFPAGEASCDDGDDDTDPAAAVVRADGGDVVIAPGERRDVLIDGLAWHVIGGAAERTFVTFGECADCPGPGTFTRTQATAVLYRVAE